MSQAKKIDVIQTSLYSVYGLSATTSDDGQHDDFIPDNNDEYKLKSYWDKRFEKESSFEWLGSFDAVKDGYEKSGIDFNAEGVDALVVGCGNSNFSSDLHMACPSWNVVSIDFSQVVIERMRARFPELTWMEMDMTNMTGFDDASFDVILDKGAMDAIVTDEGNPWDPSESSCQSVNDMIASCARVLRPGGKLSIVSFQPPHFRRKYLERAMSKCNEAGLYRWKPTITVKPVQNFAFGMDFAAFTIQRE